MSNEIKVGDRIRLTGIGEYAEADQLHPGGAAKRGMVVGNTGKVTEVFPGGVVAQLKDDQTHGGRDGRGWAFYFTEVEKVEE